MFKLKAFFFEQQMESIVRNTVTIHINESCLPLKIKSLRNTGPLFHPLT